MINNFYNVDLFFFKNYINFIFFITLFCCFLILVYSFLDLTSQVKNLRKLSSYECGFVPFNDARIEMEINFSAIAVLFIIFDIETILVLPYVINFFQLDISEFYLLFIFLFIFSAGLFYEVKKEILII
jgi:NADH-quinone oxidoreductase subunit A